MSGIDWFALVTIFMIAVAIGDVLLYCVYRTFLQSNKRETALMITWVNCTVLFIYIVVTGTVLAIKGGVS